MPRYDYKCLKCNEHFVIRHSIKEKKEICDCGKKGVLQKIPSIPIYLEKKSAGKIVRKSIEETKQEVEKEKKNMKEEFNI